MEMIILSPGFCLGMLALACILILGFYIWFFDPARLKLEVPLFKFEYEAKL
ncbi:hypothetical protein [Rhizobium rhizogenes]|uniref:hypothetical protein n=1 Tax=Rhizobium rhizogenes TaxID=359 RepID=UPI00193CC9BA|nr:hypothetical protein [Rhizobium rhizogenes]